MSDRLTATAALYALLLCACAIGAALRGRAPSPPLLAGVVLLELVLLAQAGADLIGLLGGHRPAELSTHGGYLAASILVLPLAAGFALAGRSRWDTAVLAAACLGMSVIALRLRATWAPAHD